MSTQSATELSPSVARTATPKRGKRFGGASGRIGLFAPVRVGQVALWELAILAVVATVLPWRPVSVVVAALAVVVIGVTSVRWSGLCAYQWLSVHLRFRRRARTVKGTEPLGILLPGLRFRRQIDRAGNRAGIAELGDSLTAVVRLPAPLGPRPPLVVGGLP